MPDRSTATRDINTGEQKGRRATQRERILTGMVTAANRDGYAGANVSAVIAEAGVSRPTFYEYFTDRDDCFTATAADVQQQLQQTVERTVAQDAPERALHATVAAILAWATAHPAPARFLTNETMGGGPNALQARADGLQKLADIVEKAHRKSGPDTPIPDLPVAIVIGGLYRWAAARLRRGERALTKHTEDLQRWIDSYQQPAHATRWRTVKPQTKLPRSAHLPPIPLRPPAAIAPGRPKMNEQQIAENHRQRLMHAAAAVAAEQGYGASTVGQITRAAGVDGRAFYNQFNDKQEAFMAIHELGFQEVIAVTTGAFFTADTWPERTWEACLAFLQFLQENETIAHIGFVEAYAVGRSAAQRVEDSHVAFTVFLQEGAQHADPPPPTRGVQEAVITTIFELVHQQTRRPGKPRLGGFIGHVEWLILTPYLGAEEAGRFIEGKLNGGGR
jgi:AcrR family transcriptional regulator